MNATYRGVTVVLDPEATVEQIARIVAVLARARP